jgi:hypothetical protein
MLEEQRGAFVIDPALAQELTPSFQQLYDIVTDIHMVLNLTADKVKSPNRSTTVPWDKQHGSKQAALKSLALIRREFLDALSYFCWLQTVFKERLDSQHVSQRISQKSEEWMPYVAAKKTRYFIDLGQYWREFNISLYVSRGVPIHYIWTPQMSRDPRFQRLSPVYLLCARSDQRRSDIFPHGASSFAISRNGQVRQMASRKTALRKTKPQLERDQVSLHHRFQQLDKVINTHSQIVKALRKETIL